MIYLRQSTASQEVLLGPFVDATDGNTAETGLTIANTDIKIWVAGATTLASKNSGGATHISNGNYYAVLDATDTATCGSGAIVVQVSGALAFRVNIMILEEAVFDALYTASSPGYLQPTTAGRTLDVSSTGEAGVDWANVGSPTTTVNLSGTAVKTATDVETDTADIQTRLPAALVSGRMSSDVIAISGDTGAADALETAFDDTAGPVPHMGIIDQGTAQSASSTGLVLRSAAAFDDDTLIGATLMAYGSTQGYWQSRIITDSALSGDTVTVDAWAVTPSGTITYKIFATAPSSGGAGLDAAGVRSALGMSSANLDTQLSTIDTVVDAILVDTGTTLDGKIDTIDTVVDAILVDTGTTLDGRIPAALVSGRMDCSVGAMAANVMTAAAAAADLTTELQSGLATSSALSTLQTTADAIETDTQDIQSRIPDALDNGNIKASIKRVGTTTLQSSGTGGQGYGA